MIDAFMAKIEELVDRSKGKIRADVAHPKMNVTARTASSGWDCHSARLSSTRSVIVLIVSLETGTP